MLVSLVALFGYFNSVHIYQIFRLINDKPHDRRWSGRVVLW